MRSGLDMKTWVCYGLFPRRPKGGFRRFRDKFCCSDRDLQQSKPQSAVEGNWDAMVTARGRLAQLVRALPSHGRGHWFESSIAHTEIHTSSNRRLWLV